MHPTTRLSVRLGAVITAVVAMFATLLWAMPAAAAAPGGHAFPVSDGYVLLGGDGGIFPFDVPMAGAAASDPTRCPDNVTDRTEPNGTCWSVAVTPSGLGYWILNGDTGAIYPYGTAGFYGQPATRFAGVGREFVPNMLQIVPTPDAKGYWVYESGLSGLGTVDHFGDAGFFGDTTTLVQQHGGAGFNGSAGRHGGDGRRQGLLGGPLRRRRLRVRRREVLRIDGRDAPRAGRSSASPRRPTARATGSTPPTAGSSRSATPGSAGRWAPSPFRRPSSAWPATPPVPGTGWRRPTGESSPSAAHRSSVRSYQFVVHPHRPIFAIAAKRTAVG